MATGAGALTVSLGLDAAEFVSGISKAELAAKKLEQQAAKLAKGIDKQVDALEQQAAVLGKSSREAKLYELAMKGATAAQLKSAESALAQIEAHDKLQAAYSTLATVGKVALTTLAAAAVGAVIAFNELVKGAGDFQDLAEETGATAESVASLALAAAGAGVSLESIAGATVKLTKGLTGVDDESKAVGAALTALGIPIDEFKRLDPVAQYEAVGEALAGFADGAGKTAIAVALFGKSGAEQLKVFKQLEEQGGRQVILTQKQIELADAYADAQAISAAKLKLYAQVIATEALPAVTALQNVLIEYAKELLNAGKASDGLKSNKSVSDWAEEGALFVAAFVDSLRNTAAEIKAFVAATQTEFANLKVGIALLASVPGSPLSAFRDQIGSVADALKERNAVSEAANKAYVENLNKDTTKIQDAVKRQFAAQRESATQRSAEDRGFDPRTQVSFDGAEKKAKKPKAETTSEAERYLEGLQKQTEAVQNLTIYEKALAEVQSGRLKGLTPAIESAILEQAKQLDLAKQQKEFRDAEVAAVTKGAKAQLAELDALDKGNDALRKEIDLLGLDVEGKTALELQNVRVARAEKERTLATLEATGVSEQLLQVLQAEIEALTKREALLNEKSDKQVDIAADAAAKKAGDSYRDTLSDSISEGILDGFRSGQSFSDIVLNELKAQFAKTVLSPLIKPVVDQSNKAIADLFGAIGGFFTGGSGISTNSTGTSLPTAGGKAVGGAVSARNAYVVGEHGPEILQMGSRGGTVTPNPITAREGSRQVTNNVYNNAPGVQARTAANDSGGVDTFIEAAAQRGRQLVTKDFASGTGPSAQAAKSRFSLGAGNLPKRG